MRTIRFRGKDKKSQQWVYGDLELNENGLSEVVSAKILTHNYVKSFVGGGFDSFVVSTPIICDTIGQFTGLLDKNGKEIYEGDIVKTKGNWGGVVTWNSRGYFYINDGYYTEEPDLLPLGSLNCYVRRDIEIVCNIHDNPELLKNND